MAQLRSACVVCMCCLLLSGGKCVCTCVRERERESVCMCVCVYVEGLCHSLTLSLCIIRGVYVGCASIQTTKNYVPTTTHSNTKFNST